MLGVINRVTPKKKVIGVYQRGRQHMVADGPNPNEQLPWLAAAVDEGSTIRCMFCAELPNPVESTCPSIFCFAAKAPT